MKNIDLKIIAAALSLFEAEKAISDRREPWRRCQQEHDEAGCCIALHIDPCEVCQTFLAQDGHGHKYRLAQRNSARRKLMTACRRFAQAPTTAQAVPSQHAGGNPSDASDAAGEVKG